MPELQGEKDHDNGSERREVSFARRLSNHGKSCFQEERSYDRSNASNSRRPEEIFNAHSYFLVEVKERRRRPILRNKENAGKRHGSGDQRAPADLGAVFLSTKVAGQPGCAEDKHAYYIRVMIGLHSVATLSRVA